ncbi:MAG: phosphoribosylaminoimidazolesuccinocarboxamide synthase [Bacteroidetes bacterium]|nr:phosphoribosylaminoimidazolesuccinocarboxamide synthase [Bacteroidota bacterium]MBS1628944.1 phosphoribosylaminoimidazolesuccinocarboxamide synthase [Bacteroidota bacterium]
MLQLSNQTAFYKGKVRDVYTIQDQYLAMVVSDRISAFDVVLPRPIPFKGAVLNQIAAIMLQATEDIVPNWVIKVPLPNATIGYKCDTYPVEMIVRGYIAGSAWRAYKAGKRDMCGVPLPEGLHENDKLPMPILTPTTKAQEGHDEDITREEIISSGLIPQDEYEQLEKYALALFARGQEMAAARGLILVDTKYEFGKREGVITLIDEIHTPDSSRYFYKEGYEERQAAGQAQKQLSKEFVREWLMEHGFQGKDGQQVPEMNDAVVRSISERYMELYEKVIGKSFNPEADKMDETHMKQVLEAELAKLK